MTNQLFPPDLSNPLARWADLTLRTMDATLSSAQNVGDDIDRVTRAAASAPVAAAAPAAALARETGSPRLFPLALTAALQRSALDWMAQGWLQWVSMMGTVAGAAARRRLDMPIAGDELPTANAASGRGSAGAEAAVRSARLRANVARTSRKQQELAGHAGREHAFAQSEAKRKRGTKKAGAAKAAARAAPSVRG